MNDRRPSIDWPHRGQAQFWRPVDGGRSPWLVGREPITVARTYYVAKGPHLLRVADARAARRGKAH